MFMPNNSSHWFQRSLTADLINIALAVFIVFLGLQLLVGFSTIKNNQVGQQRLITVDATGESNVRPNIAQVSMGLSTNAKTVSDAQQKNTESMNGFIKRLDSIGILEKDRKTANYSVQPHYDYNDTTKKSDITGYDVSNTVVVNVRDLTKIPQVIGLASDFGLNQVGGLSFTFDNPDMGKDQARKIAFQKARSKAQAMANAAGIRLGRVVGLSESGGMIPPMPMMYDSVMMKGVGGAQRPDIESGSQNVSVSVSMTFEIL